MAQGKAAVIRSDLDIVIARTLARDTAKNMGFGAIDQARAGADLAAVADDGAALQDRAGVQGHVAAELDGDVDERLSGIEHRDPVQQPAAIGAAA